MSTSPSEAQSVPRGNGSPLRKLAVKERSPSRGDSMFGSERGQGGLVLARAGAISRTWYLFLKRHANAVGIYRAELFCAPGLGLQWAVGMHFASALLVFGIQGFDAFYGEAHHGLVADLARQFFVAHAGYVQVSLAAVDSYIGRRRGVAKGFREAADLCPPIQRFRCVSGRKNGDRAFYDRVHVRSIIESSGISYNRQVRVVRQFPVTALIRTYRGHLTY